MSTTTSRPKDELRECSSKGAACAGKAVHTCIHHTVAEWAAQTVFHAELDCLCEERCADFFDTGETVDLKAFGPCLSVAVADIPAEDPVPLEPMPG